MGKNHLYSVWSYGKINLTTIIMKRKLKPWEQWEVNAKKAKEKIMKRTCSNCKQTIEINGISAYPGLCKKCVEVN